LAGVILLAFALGWALLAALSLWLSDHPQRWAVAPAIFLGLAGIIELAGSPALLNIYKYVWPPVLIVIVWWAWKQARQHLPGVSRTWLVYPLLAALGISAIGGGYQAIGEAFYARAYHRPGQLVDVGGHRLHLNCTGTGGPTVILEGGAGAESLDFAWITPRVAGYDRVCVYDRGGRGWSDPEAGPEDADMIAANLHTLLDHARVPGPYVLVGHSFGGLYVLNYAAKYPDQIAGMVLLDSTAPKPGAGAAEKLKPNSGLERVAALISTLTHIGLGRLIAEGSYGSLPPQSRGEARANASTARNLQSFIEEFGMANRSTRQAGAITSLNGKPLIVVTADLENNDPQWQTKQDNLAKLSTNSLHRHAKATHDSLLADEADSAAASQAIHDVVEAIRAGRPLKH
jgi:pimeloyl-ACP methyl ester carboxylesterase